MKLDSDLPPSIRSALRQPLPDTTPRPGFESRLLAQLKDAPGPVRRLPLGVPALAGAGAAVCAAAFHLFLSTPPPSAPVTNHPPRPDRPVLELNNVTTPLRSEAAAVGQSASRAGEFLLGFLPSVPEPQG